MKLKAAMFDIDGTLIDSIEDLYLTMNSVLNSGGYPRISREKVKHLIGNGARRFMELSLPEGARDKENVDRYLLKYHAEYEKNGCKNTVPFEGITEILQKLSENNILLAVISNKPHPAAVNVIKTYFPKTEFKVVMGQREDFPPKPDPASSLYAAKMLGFPPENIALIGDGDADAMAANNGGFYQAAVLWGYRTKEELEAAGAKNFLSKPSQILDIFDIFDGKLH